MSTLVEEDFKVNNKQYFTEEAKKDMRLIKKKNKKAFDCIDSSMNSRGPWRIKKADSMEAVWAQSSLSFVEREDTGRRDVLLAPFKSLL